jgi:hypothetical protein
VCKPSAEHPMFGNAAKVWRRTFRMNLNSKKTSEVLEFQSELCQGEFRASYDLKRIKTNDP